MTHTVKAISIPRTGMFATVRNRRGVVASWRRCKEGLAEGEAAAGTEVASSRKSMQRDTGDDRVAETQSPYLQRGK